MSELHTKLMNKGCVTALLKGETLCPVFRHNLSAGFRIRAICRHLWRFDSLFAKVREDL